MKILLSTWFGPIGLIRFREEMAALKPQPKVAIIHNALRFGWYRKLHEQSIIRKFKKLGYECEVVDLLKSGWLEKIQLCRVVYVGGGDTRRLLNTLRADQCGDKIFHHLDECNGIYIGVSAGAIVCGYDVDPGDWLGDSQKVSVASNRGFNSLPDNAVVMPHYNKRKHADIISTQKKNGSPRPIWELRNNEAIFLIRNGPYRYD